MNSPDAARSPISPASSQVAIQSPLDIPSDRPDHRLVPSTCDCCSESDPRRVDTDYSSIMECSPNPCGIYIVSLMIDEQFDIVMTALGNESLGMAL